MATLRIESKNAPRQWVGDHNYQNWYPSAADSYNFFTIDGRGPFPLTGNPLVLHYDEDMKEIIAWHIGDPLSDDDMPVWKIEEIPF